METGEDASSLSSEALVAKCLKLKYFKRVALEHLMIFGNNGQSRAEQVDMLQFLCSLCVCVLFSFPAFKEEKSGLPWWLSGKESTCQCRGHGFSPWSRKIPHEAPVSRDCAPQQEKPHNAKSSHHDWREAPALCNQRGPVRSSESPARP